MSIGDTIYCFNCGDELAMHRRLSDGTAQCWKTLAAGSRLCRCPVWQAATCGACGSVNLNVVRVWVYTGGPNRLRFECRNCGMNSERELLTGTV